MENSETIEIRKKPVNIVVSEVVEEDKKDGDNTSEEKAEMVFPVEGTQPEKEVPTETCLTPVEPEETEDKDDTDHPEVARGDETKEEGQDPLMDTTPAPVAAEEEEEEGTPMTIEIRKKPVNIVVSEVVEEDKKADGNTCDPLVDSTPTPVAAEEEEGTPMVTVSFETEEKKKEAEEEGETKNGDITVNGKRKAESTAETTPSKKTKLINDGFCLHVGNLNTSKKYEELKESLASYFMSQSILIQNIRVHTTRKYAFVDLASEFDLTKALTLNGTKILDKAMRLNKAMVKQAVKVKPPPEDPKDKVSNGSNARCLFLKNVPYDATKEDILTVFDKAVCVRFPGDTEGPGKGIAFVEFETEAIADEFVKTKQGAKIQDRVLIVESLGEKSSYTPKKASDEAVTSTILAVNNLAFTVKEKTLKKVYKKAVSIDIPLRGGKSSGYAFVEFATVDDAKEAMESSDKMEIHEREIKVSFCCRKPKETVPVVPSKTLIVIGLAKGTNRETLQSAFEGAIRARINSDRQTGASKGFGFVEFESQEDCDAAKGAMEDCKIDGKKVFVNYAKPKGEPGPPGVRVHGGGGGGGRGAKGSGRGGGRGGGGRGGGGGDPERNPGDGGKGEKVKGAKGEKVKGEKGGKVKGAKGGKVKG